MVTSRTILFMSSETTRLLDLFTSSETTRLLDLFTGVCRNAEIRALKKLLVGLPANPSVVRNEALHAFWEGRHRVVTVLLDHLAETHPIALTGTNPEYERMVSWWRAISS